MRTTLSIGIGILIFCVLGGSEHADQDQLGTPIAVTMCDLAKHPEEYYGKMVSLRAGSVGGLWISDDALHDRPARPCPEYLNVIVVFPERVKPSSRTIP